MAHIEAQRPDHPVAPKQKKSSAESKAYVRSSLFKYYIHDGVGACRLELLGELSEAEIPELSGCWSTAKTTLAERKLVLDLRHVSKVDDSGKQWIILMANEGAVLLPEAFIGNGFACEPAAGEASRTGFLARIVAVFRGSRELAAQSSTPAP